jgi:hypothetical protein
VPRNDHWKVLYKIQVFYADGISKMATTAGNRLTLDPTGKCSNAFFSETTIWGKYRNMFFSEVIALIEPKLCINHWKVLYKLCVFILIGIPR